MTSTEIANASKIMLGSTEAAAMYIGSTLIWTAGGSGGSQYQANGLPTGWTELQYISSTSSGGQYIDLNIKLYETLGTDYDIAIKYNAKGRGGGSSSDQTPTLFGCQQNINPFPGTFIRMHGSGTYTIGRYIGGNSKDNTLANINTIKELPVRTSPNKNVTNINNNSKTHSWGTSLFCAFSNDNNSPFRFIEADLYYFKLFVGGTLVRDLIPCKDTNNTVGMYDIVNHVFYTSPNGAAFVAGPTV